MPEDLGVRHDSFLIFATFFRFRERQGAHGRGMVAYLARLLAGQRVKDIAERFQRSPMRISQAIIEFENKLRGDESLRKMTEKLK